MNQLSTPRFWNATRTRLLILVLLVTIPAMALQVFGAWIDLRQEMAGGEQESLAQTYSIDELYARTYRNLFWKLAFMTLLTVGILALAFYASEAMFLRPLDRLMGVVKRVQGGDLGARISDLRGLGELTDLAQSFNQMTDALQRREHEQRLSEERFRAAFESSAIGIGLMTLDGWIITANAAVCRMSGYSEAELKLRNDRQNAYPEDVDVGAEQFSELIAGKRGYYSIEKRYVRKNGEVFWTRVTLSLVRDESGQPAYLIGMVEDIDEAKRKSAALAESEARFQTLFNTAAVGVGILGLDRKLIDANPALCRMFGYTREELLGETSNLVTHPDDLPRAVQYHHDLLDGKVEHYFDERRYLRKDGTVFWASISMSMVRDEAGKPLYLVGMVNDINERLREKAAQDAVQAERTRLARDLHDAVTQTLFSTTLIADVLPELWEMDREEGLRRLEELRKLTRGSLAEMRTLLVELRPNALVEIPLPTLLHQLVDALAGRARVDIQLSAEGERRLPGDVQVSLYRIAQEALNNVVKHANAREAVLTLRMGETVRLSVADNGRGFDMSLVTSDHLGLKIMRERAEAIGAKLVIYSEPGEGTQISVLWQGKAENL